MSGVSAMPGGRLSCAAVHPLAPFTVPPKLVLRALDDLHVLAQAAGRAMEVMERLDRRGAAIVALGERIDERADALLALGERIDARADAILALGTSLSADGRALLDQGKVLQEHAAEVARRGADVAAALPALQRAVELGEPLEGAVERLGRIVDRLPGGKRPPLR